MANGAAAATLLPEPDSAIERRIGDLLVTLAAVSMRACIEVPANRHMRPDTKRRGGELVAELIEVQTTLNGKFVDTVHRVGRHRYCAAGLSEAVADKTIGGILELVDRVNVAARDGTLIQ